MIFHALATIDAYMRLAEISSENRYTHADFTPQSFPFMKKAWTSDPGSNDENNFDYVSNDLEMGETTEHSDDDYRTEHGW